MSGLVRDGTAEPLPRDQTLRREPREEKIVFPVQLTTRRIGNHPYPVDPYLLKVFMILTYQVQCFCLTENICALRYVGLHSDST